MENVISQKSPLNESKKSSSISINDKKKKNSRNFLSEERHRSSYVPSSRKISKWRIKDRMKTQGVAFVYCLNIGVDPPDVIKPDPCARLECWLDPMGLPQQKALETIAKELQNQYESQRPNGGQIRYKMGLDPTVDEVKKLCLSLRRNVKDERVVFHYNGHGVPKPTNNGEMWVFNKNYTQYIPLSIYELQNWVGSSSVYLFDCNQAGLIVNWFLQFAEQREKEFERLSSSASPSAVVPLTDYILLASCGATELLPMNPHLPADVFTACLTTPIKMALRWFVSNSPLSKQGISFETVDKIPGKLTDRRTPLGELNWIFTAITDTIAWNVLPRDLFQRLFRQDLLVASLFRNFLLAERIMRSHNCTPISFPKLPPQTFQHPMWQSWDLAVDICLSQLPAIIADPTVEYKPSTFFTDQLTAFDVWLEFGSERKKPPEQLPIVLQVLLSQSHRLRALNLLAKFLDLGPWAVNLALSVGIFRYVLKLLQNSTSEFRQVLVFIWTKILALDKSCQLDLVKETGHLYFITVLASPSIDPEQRTMAAFILSVICNNCRPGQSACLAGNLMNTCIAQLSDPDPVLRKWVVLCLAKLWESFEDAKTIAIREGAHERVCSLLADPIPEVRAAVVFALGTFFGGADSNDSRLNIELNIGITLPVVTEDVSPIVRRELIIALSHLTHYHEKQFKDAVSLLVAEEKSKDGNNPRTSSVFGRSRKGSAGKPPRRVEDDASASTQSSVYSLLWKLILTLANDPVPELSKMAEFVVRSIMDQIVTPSTPGSPTSSSKKLKMRSSLKPTSLHASINLRSGPISPNSAQSMKKTVSMEANLLSSRADSDDESVAPPLPTEDLQSTFYEWSSDHFSKPMLAKEQDDAGPVWTKKRWRQQRNESTLAESKTLGKVTVSRFDEQVAILDNSPETASSVLLHAFDPYIVIADGKDGIVVWDKDSCQRIHAFKNKPSPDSPVTHTTGMCFINEHDNTILLVGADDGTVRAWSSIEDSTKCSPVLSWKALTDVSSTRGAGLVLNWQQDYGLLATSGDATVIRLWDLEKEQLIQDVSTGSDCCVTSIAFGASNGCQALIAGYGDGSIRLFDHRVPGKYGCLWSATEHKEWVVNVQAPKSDGYKIISGSTQGDVKFWDIRTASNNPAAVKPVKSIAAHRKGMMTAMAVHDYAPLLATGSEKQKIKVFQLSGEEVSEIRYHYGFLGQRIGPVSCLTFHPYLMLLAAGGTDSIVSLYTRC